MSGGGGGLKKDLSEGGGILGMRGDEDLGDGGELGNWDLEIRGDKRRVRRGRGATSKQENAGVGEAGPV